MQVTLEASSIGAIVRRAIRLALRRNLRAVRRVVRLRRRGLRPA